MRSLILIAMFSVGSFATCGKSAVSRSQYQFVAHQGEFVFNGGNDDVGLIWKKNGIGLVKKTFGTRITNSDDILVMVSYSNQSQLDSFYMTGESILAEAKQPNSPQGYLLFSLKDTKPLDHLALLAHGSQTFGCGHLEVIDQTLDLSSAQDEYQPTLYAEQIPLDDVSAMQALVDTARIRTTMQSLEHQGTRFHNSDSGQATPSLVADIFQEADPSGNLSLAITFSDHALTPQKSVIAKIVGQNPELPHIIVGSHLDSIHGNPGSNQEEAPGADDNASGVAVIAEVIRVLSSANAQFSRTIEFHAYAAEEIGLVGSSNIASSYRSKSQRVAMMMQLDMTSYSSDPNSETIYLVEDDTSPLPNASTARLIETYLGGDYSFGQIGGGGTSDHRSWSIQGFQTVFPFENPQDFNPLLHTPDDTTANANNLPLTGRFAKLVLAALSHHAGLLGAQSEYLNKLKAANLSGDLAVAIVPGTSEDQVRWVVGSPKLITDMELCQLNSQNFCEQERVTLSAGGTRNDRSFHVTDVDMKLDHGSVWRVYGYDSAGRLSYLRDLRAVKPATF